MAPSLPPAKPTGPANGDRPGNRAPVRLHAGGVAVEFRWVDDRWRHVVTIPEGGPAAAPDHHHASGEWRSVEGAAAPLHDPRRPSSPAITELSVIGSPHAGRAILGVGHAGCGHCSLSVTIDEDDPRALRFDVACRLAGAWPGLGSTYTDPASGAVVAVVADQAAGDEARRTVAWAYRIGPGGWEAVAGAAVRPGEANADSP